jgi:hypothetical protein
MKKLIAILLLLCFVFTAWWYQDSSDCSKQIREDSDFFHGACIDLTLEKAQKGDTVAMLQYQQHLLNTATKENEKQMSIESDEWIRKASVGGNIGAMGYSLSMCGRKAKGFSAAEVETWLLKALKSEQHLSDEYLLTKLVAFYLGANNCRSVDVDLAAKYIVRHVNCDSFEVETFINEASKINFKITPELKITLISNANLCYPRTDDVEYEMRKKKVSSWVDKLNKLELSTK